MTRDNRPADPTSEATSDPSTLTSSGLGGGRPRDEQDAPERARDEQGHERENRDQPEPIPGRKRYEGEGADPTMPSDDTTLRTEI